MQTHFFIQLDMAWCGLVLQYSKCGSRGMGFMIILAVTKQGNLVY